MRKETELLFNTNNIELDVANIMQEKLSELARKLEEKKIAVLNERLIERGFSHLLPLEKQKDKIFKDIIVSMHDNEERWYARDPATGEGVLIIAFLTETSPPKIMERNGLNYGITATVKWK